MAMNKYLNAVDTEGKLSSSSAPSSDNDLVNKTYVDQTIAVTVNSTPKFALDGEAQASASLQKSGRFVFDLSSASGSHPFKLSATSDGTHGGGSEYTTGVTSVGSQGSAGAKLIIELTQATPDTLYYYCSSHSGMGGAIYTGAMGGSITQASDGKVGIGVTSPSRSLDVSGDIKVRGGDILGSHTSLPAIQMDASSNVTIPQNLTVTGTTSLNGVDYTWPSSDGSSGQFLSTNGSKTLSWATASGGGGSGGFSLSSIDANITIGEIQTAFNAASAKGWSVSPSGLSIPSGKTLLGVSCELQNTLGKDSFGSFSPIYGACAIGIEDPSGSTVMPTIIGGAWNAGTNYSQGSPYLSAQVGPALGWYYQDSSYNSNYILNDGTTTTDYITSFGSACIKVSSSTQVKVYFYEDTSSSVTFKINSSASASTSVVAKLTIFYA